MRILIVCLGNICRSPLGHGCLEHLVSEAGLEWEVDSAGTGAWHIGNMPDKRAIAVAKKNNIDISHQRARQIQTSDFDKFDHIFVMDQQNYDDVLALAANDKQRSKVKLFLGEETYVKDPYWDDTLFEPVFNQIFDHSRQLIEELSNKPTKAE